MIPDTRWPEMVTRPESRRRVRFAFALGLLLGIWLCFGLSIAWRVLVLGA